MAQGIKICITGDALVALPEGESVRIADIVPGARPNSDNAIDLKVLDRHGNPVLADRLFHSGEHPVYTVRTVEGLRVTGTANHPLLCLVDVAGVPTLLWKLIDEIKPGDYAVIQRSAFSVDCAGFARGKPEFAPTTYTVGVPGLVRFLEAHHRDPDAQAIADELTDGRFYYAKVASVTDAGVQPVYSLRVDTADHAFITNGFVSHATGLTGLNSGLTTNPGVSAWQVNTAYTAGQLVTYNGKTYKCLQPHTSLAGWEPSNVPALWQLQ
ncbi:carbohydrate-binding protein [Vibrio ostreicida]|uniref:carbohydrate-binding protein n=1 Tax=Gammaproteobacteria TaxID=1236 RepID=UPI002EB9A832|nr:carbohydrate-binding protein [Serratia liquefaciens]